MSKQKSGGGARKIGRNKAHQAVIYAREGRWDSNRERAMRQHLRDNPHDTKTAAEFEKRYGKVQSLGLSCRGKKLVKRAAKRAQQSAAA